MNSFKSRFILYLLIAALVAGAAIWYIKNKYPANQEVTEKIETNVPVEPVKNNTTTPETNLATTVPKTLLLKIPFTPQAPTANWDELHNEACEEASAIMASAYLNDEDHSPTLDAPHVEDEISKLTQWETDHFGYHLDINSEETAQVIKNVYGLNTKIVTDYDSDYIKQELAQNHVVLLPANGVKLGNPNFRSPGPPYHMIVLKGYDEHVFISNDPGTKRGMNYPYTFSALYNANGDFDHATHSVDLTKKNIIIVWK